MNRALNDRMIDSYITPKQGISSVLKAPPFVSARKDTHLKDNRKLNHRPKSSFLYKQTQLESFTRVLSQKNNYESRLPKIRKNSFLKKENRNQSYTPDLHRNEVTKYIPPKKLVKKTSNPKTVKRSLSTKEDKSFEATKNFLAKELEPINGVKLSSQSTQQKASEKRVVKKKSYRSLAIQTDFDDYEEDCLDESPVQCFTPRYRNEHRL